MRAARADSATARRAAFLRIVSGALLAGAAVSLLVRFTVRDRVPGLDIVFYATRPVLALVAAVVGGAILLRVGTRRQAVLAGLLAAASAVVFATASFVRGSPQTPGVFRGVFWNVQDGVAGWDRVAEQLRALVPDVVFLAEAGTAEGESVADAALRAAFPDHRLLRIRGRLIALVRGEVEVLRNERTPHRVRVVLLRVTVSGRSFECVFPDIGAGRTARTEAFERVERIVGPRAATPLLVLGDFNLPRDSVAFDSWRPHLAHAFETAGRGYDATWPVPVPLLCLDHVWAAGGVAVRTCELPWTDLSDHLPIVFSFDLP
jgi:endonuclease/exonuclease/phosphatase family metal-dependent hydrolase